MTSPQDQTPPEIAKRQPQVRQLVLTTLLFMLGVVWIGGAYPNGDPLWFYPVFDEQPSYILIHHYGATVEAKPGTPGFDNLVKAINAEIPRNSGYQVGLRPVGDTLKYYQTQGYSIEIAYPIAAQVHTRYYFPAAAQLLIAIDGPYNYTKSILLFRGNGKTWLPGGIALINADSIRLAAEAIAGH